MKKFSFVLAVLASVFAACTTAPQAGGGTAAQLARQLNAMHEGSTRVSGDTVTLTRGVGIERDLTVPEGVTLELTEDGGLWLRNGRTLTVNGTVNAPSNRIGFDDEGGRTAPSVTINGNGTINLTDKGRLLNIDNGRKLTLDGVTLVGVDDNDSPLVSVNEGGELVLVSGEITGNARIGDSGNGGGVAINGGTFIMSGGAITGNNAGIGGGVWIEGGGTFTMSGGEISGNSADRFGGGGVRVTGQGTTFTMSGGEISGNTAINDGGGGINVDRGAIFTMTGGEISGNSAPNGAGVTIALGATFTMSGGTISGNSAGYGGGIDVNEGTTFTMKNGTISSNTCTSNGGGIHSSGNSTLSMEGGTISGNSATQQGGGVYLSVKGVTFTMTGGTIYGSSTQGGNANTAPNGAAIFNQTTARWGTGGTYTRGGVNQSGGGNIASTNDTLIAIPAR